MTDSVPGSTWTRERFNEELRQTVGSTSQVIDLYRRYLNQIWEERDRLSALASAAAAARDTAIADQKNTSEALRKVKERLRDAKAGLPSPPTYRLPEWLGGHEVKLGNQLDEIQTVYVSGPAGEVQLHLRLDELVEIKPPSIDDPEPLPLNIRAMAGGLNVDVVLCTVYPDGAQLKIDDSDYVIHANLTSHGLRRLARAAWQRANAIEGGAS